MRTARSRWVGSVGTAAKLAVVVFLMWLWHAYLQFAIIGATLVGLRVLVSRSETASVVLGMPVDERWSSINAHAWALAAQLSFVAVLATLVALQVLDLQGTHVDATPYLLSGAVLATTYMGGVLWFRWAR